MIAMQFDTEYYYRGIERWSLGWQTPNFAAAFVVQLLSYAWVLTDQRRTRVLWLVGEGVLYWMLLKTYSRGGMIAAVSAAVVFITLSRGLGRRTLREWLWICVLVSSVAVLIGAIDRISPSEMVRDRSATNRIPLWLGGLEMISTAPVSGWGDFSSGSVYVNWFQDSASTEDYVSLVNSFLTVAAEHGLPWLFVVSALCCFVLIIAREDRVRQCVLVHGAAACVTSWLVVNQFSTLYREPYLHVLPLASACVIIVARLTSAQNRWSRPFAYAAGFAFCSTALVGVAGLMFHSQRDFSVSCNSNCDAVITVKQPRNLREWSCFWDVDVFGKNPGKHSVRFLKRVGSTRGYMVLSPQTAGKHSSVLLDGRSVLVSGRYAALLNRTDTRSRGEELWIVHPTCEPPESLLEFADVSLFLPEIDEAGVVSLWREWAERNRVAVYYSDGCANDVRPRWNSICSF